MQRAPATFPAGDVSRRKMLALQFAQGLSMPAKAGIRLDGATELSDSRFRGNDRTADWDFAGASHSGADRVRAAVRNQQGIVLLVFIVLGVLAARRFRPGSEARA